MRARLTGVAGPSGCSEGALCKGQSSTKPPACQVWLGAAVPGVPLPGLQGRGSSGSASSRMPEAQRWRDREGHPSSGLDPRGPRAPPKEDWAEQTPPLLSPPPTLFRAGSPSSPSTGQGRGGPERPPSGRIPSRPAQCSPGRARGHHLWLSHAPGAGVGTRHTCPRRRHGPLAWWAWGVLAVRPSSETDTRAAGTGLGSAEADRAWEQESWPPARRLSTGTPEQVGPGSCE